MLHSALTLCISIQQRKTAHGEGNFGTSTYARHSVSHSLCLLELLCLDGNPLRTRKNALWLQHKEKPHSAYKHTYSTYIHMTSSCCCCCRALHISTSSLSLYLPLSLSLSLAARQQFITFQSLGSSIMPHTYFSRSRSESSAKRSQWTVAWVELC